MNDDSRFTVKFNWLKGFEMENAQNKFIQICIGIAILGCSLGCIAALLIKVIAPHGLV